MQDLNQTEQRPRQGPGLESQTINKNTETYI